MKGNCSYRAATEPGISPGSAPRSSQPAALGQGACGEEDGAIVHQAGLLTERIQEALRVSSKR